MLLPLACVLAPTSVVLDVDGDGFTQAVDCDDDDPAVHPLAVDVPYDGQAQDCDGADRDDLDGDGHDLAEDCDDQDPEVHPDAWEEPGNGVDEDCDGEDGVVEDTGSAADRDGDGWAPAEGDCDDDDPESHPGLAEACNGFDDDCDGEVDELTLDDAIETWTGSGLGGCSPWALSAGGDLDGDGTGDHAVVCWHTDSALRVVAGGQIVERMFAEEIFAHSVEVGVDLDDDATAELLLGMVEAELLGFAGGRSFEALDLTAPDFRLVGLSAGRTRPWRWC